MGIEQEEVEKTNSSGELINPSELLPNTPLQERQQVGIDADLDSFIKERVKRLKSNRIGMFNH